MDKKDEKKKEKLVNYYENLESFTSEEDGFK